MSEKDRVDAEAAAARTVSRGDWRVNGAQPAQSRGWFQMHLSTAVVLMVVVGALLLMNTTPQLDKEFPSQDFAEFGWPYVACTRRPAYSVQVIVGVEMPEQHYPAQLDWNNKAVAVDVAVGTICLATIAGLLEFNIRRRETYKP